MNMSSTRPLSSPASLENLTIAELIERQKPGRKVKGIAASLLPFQQDGRIAVDAFQKNLVATHQSGLMNAVNMDTGYVNYLSQAEKQQILGWTREALGNGVPFVAGDEIRSAEDRLAFLERGHVVDHRRRAAVAGNGRERPLHRPDGGALGVAWDDDQVVAELLQARRG